jgi:hypothetical protein
MRLVIVYALLVFYVDIQVCVQLAVATDSAGGSKKVTYDIHTNKILCMPASAAFTHDALYLQQLRYHLLLHIVCVLVYLM